MSFIFDPKTCFGCKNSTNVPYEFQFMSEHSLDLFRFSTSCCLPAPAEICDSDERYALGSTTLAKGGTGSGERDICCAHMYFNF